MKKLLQEEPGLMNSVMGVIPAPCTPYVFSSTEIVLHPFREVFEI